MEQWAIDQIDLSQITTKKDSLKDSLELRIETASAVGMIQSLAVTTKFLRVIEILNCRTKNNPVLIG